MEFFPQFLAGPDVLQDTPSLPLPEVEDMKRKHKFISKIANF